MPEVRKPIAAPTLLELRTRPCTLEELQAVIVQILLRQARTEIETQPLIDAPFGLHD